MIGGEVVQPLHKAIQTLKHQADLVLRPRLCSSRLLGEVLEAWTFSRARRAMGRLVEQTPRTARIRRDGLEVEIPAHQVAVGDRVIVRPGERIPIDGRVVSGRSTVDQSAAFSVVLPIDKGLAIQCSPAR